MTPLTHEPKNPGLPGSRIGAYLSFYHAGSDQPGSRFGSSTCRGKCCNPPEQLCQHSVVGSLQENCTWRPRFIINTGSCSWDERNPNLFSNRNHFHMAILPPSRGDLPGCHHCH